MNINTLSSTNFNGLRIDSIKAQDKMTKQLDAWLHDTNSRIRLAEKVKACVNAKAADVRIRKDGDIFLINNITKQITPIKHPGNNVTKKFIKAINMALKVKE